MTLAIENLTCIRGNHVVFKQLGVCLGPGSLLILKGANGAGKTSLIKLLCGLLTPYEGRVLWKGVPIGESEEYAHAFTLVSTKNALKSSLSVRKNLEFYALLWGREELLEAAMHYFGLTPLAGVRVGELSSGWQRRCALARLILSPAEIWLLDEPTNFLDDEAMALMSQLVEARIVQGGIVVMASHGVNSSFDAHVLRMEDFR